MLRAVSKNTMRSLAIHHSEIVGNSLALRRTLDRIETVAPTDAAVLILGESGVGKELISRAIHRQSSRADRPLVVVNCAAIPDCLFESEFFGHRKGSFTGAVSNKDGLVQSADGGTLFLDEIADLPLAMQVKLLRVIQENTVRPVGSSEELPTNARILSATHKKLGQMVASGEFREDLYYRINVIELHVPSLRDRDDDVIALAEHILRKLNSSISFDDGARVALLKYAFPGNVRELRNVLQRAVLMRQGEVLTRDDITFMPSTLVDRVQVKGAVSGRTLLEIERQAIVTELGRHKGNKTEAAASLGVSRATIHRKIAEYDIDLEALASGG